MTDSGLRRPFEVWVAVIVTWIAAFADLVLGAILMLASFGTELLDLPEDISTREMRYGGAGLMLLGLVTIAVALGLAAGSQLSRWVVILIMAARVAGTVYVILNLHESVQQAMYIEAGGALLVMLLLLTPRAFRFFAGRP